MRHPFRVICPKCETEHEEALINSKELKLLYPKYTPNSAARLSDGFPKPVIPPHKPQGAWWLEREIVEYERGNYKEEVKELPKEELRRRLEILQDMLGSS